MKVKDLIKQLQLVNQEADVLVQTLPDWEEGPLESIETDPTSTKELSALVKLIVNFNVK